MLKVLWLASWYPNRIDAFNGDFTERHAKAMNGMVDLTVISVVKDQTLKSGEVQIEKEAVHGITVYRGYYGGSDRNGWVEKMRSFFRSFRLQLSIYRRYMQEYGKPAIVHVHVAMKAGLLALWLKRRNGLNYVLTEHWTGYYQQSVPNIYTAGFLFRFFTRQVIRGAARFLPVTEDLGRVISNSFVPVRYQVVPNVVDTTLFFFKTAASRERFRFIHASYLNYQKNPAGMIRACSLLVDRGLDFELLLVGKKDEELNQIIAAEELKDIVDILPAVPYPEVARLMQQSDALLMFSRFENLPCVITEALCCGLPVISTNVGGVAEVINDRNGILVENGDEQALANAMEKMIRERGKYDKARISAAAIDQFNYNTVGRQYLDVYQNILNQP